eukprot:1721038-Pleurochrysis_carterae.AAC.4
MASRTPARHIFTLYYSKGHTSSRIRDRSSSQLARERLRSTPHTYSHRRIPRIEIRLEHV